VNSKSKSLRWTKLDLTSAQGRQLQPAATGGQFLDHYLSPLL
jgi:hypothetical protein